MATDKKSFILYTDLIHTIESLKDDEAGMLFKHLLRYVNDLNPDAPDRIIQLVFEPIKQQLKRDLKDWEKTIIGKSEGGKKSAEIRKNLKLIKDDVSILKSVQHTSTNSTDNVNVNVTVNDNVNVNDTVNVKEKKDIIIDSVFLKKSEVEILKEKFGVGYLWAIETLSNYKQSSGKKYKSDYHALIGWVHDKFLKEKQNQNGKTDPTTAPRINGLRTDNKFTQALIRDAYISNSKEGT